MTLLSPLAGQPAPEGSESIDEIYAESFRSQSHLEAIVTDAQATVSSALGAPDHGAH